MTDVDSRRAFRDLLGSMPAGVCVITTDGPAGRAGMTASSVCSLSLQPLLLLVCLGNGSGTLHAIRRNSRFAVNLLHEDHERTADVFATDRPAGEKFADAGFHLVDGSPVLRQALGWLTCRVYSTVPGGDHTVVLGEVLDLSRSGGQSLVWHHSRYGYHRTAHPTLHEASLPLDPAHTMDRP
ncbi:flavin reductase family protein [Kitasatospora sp. NBC_01539]|uniref:flavin reductase family protein n=1 Tax=Kitasatospora sp. NBC_01539 TaxID=2903577 RepID=UPI003860245B